VDPTPPMQPSPRTELAKASEVAPLGPEDQAYLRLWFSLARRPWRSLVLVPSFPGGSADEPARLLAEVGQKVSGLPVQAIMMSSLDYGTAQALADLQDQVRRLHEEQAEPPQAIEVYPVEHHDEQDGHAQEHAAGEAPNWAFVRPPVESPHEPRPGPPPGEPLGDGPAGPRMYPLPASRFVIGVPFLLNEPLGLSATQAADAVLVLVQLGKTRTSDLKAILDQVGRDRVAGCILVK